MARPITRGPTHTTTVSIDYPVFEAILRLIGKDKPHKSITEAIQEGLKMVLKANNHPDYNEDTSTYWHPLKLAYQCFVKMNMNHGNFFLPTKLQSHPIWYHNELKVFSKKSCSNSELASHS